VRARALKSVENACFVVGFFLIVWYEILWWQAYLQRKPWP
jgi:hypothetical protein